MGYRRASFVDDITGNYGVPRGRVRDLVEVAMSGGQVLYVKGSVGVSESVKEKLAENARRLSRLRAEGVIERGQVEGMSYGSRRRFEQSFYSHVGVLRRGRAVFMTLTHGRDGGSDWQESKSALNAWLQVIRRHQLPVCGWWVAELQARGAVHYHLALGGGSRSDYRLLGDAWLRITGCEGSPLEDREYYGVHINSVRSGCGSEVQIGKYLNKARLVSEMAKGEQKGEAYGRTWGVVQRLRLAAYRNIGSVVVDSRQYFQACVILAKVLDRLRGVHWVPEAGEPVCRPVSLTHSGSAAEWALTGDVEALVNAFVIPHRKGRRPPRWNRERVEEVVAEVLAA